MLDDRAILIKPLRIESGCCIDNLREDGIHGDRLEGLTTPLQWSSYNAVVHPPEGGPLSLDCDPVSRLLARRVG